MNLSTRASRPITREKRTLKAIGQLLKCFYLFFFKSFVVQSFEFFLVIKQRKKIKKMKRNITSAADGYTRFFLKRSAGDSFLYIDAYTHFVAFVSFFFSFFFLLDLGFSRGPRTVGARNPLGPLIGWRLTPLSRLSQDPLGQQQRESARARYSRNHIVMRLKSVAI